MKYAEAYIRYLIYFHVQRDYFECHEVLEEHWKEHGDDPASAGYVGLIQLAVSLYHQRRGNRPGAVKMLEGALRKLTPVELQRLGIDADELHRRMQDRLTELAQPEFVFTDLNIPIADPELEAACLKLLEPDGSAWGRPSDPEDTFLCNKHTLRDRSGVIAERQRSQQERRGEA